MSHYFCTVEEGSKPNTFSSVDYLRRGNTSDPGEISSRREPTAENARMARTPRDLRADIWAREGTAEGESTWRGYDER